MHKGHRKRMKERYLKDGGFENFAPHEILEMLLYSTIARGDTNPVAHELIEKFGSLANVFDAEPAALKQVKGIGESSAFLLSMIPHLSRVYNQAKWDRKVMLGTVDLAGQYAINLFIGKSHEEFRIICVDSNRQVFYQGVVTKGTINEVPAYPRLVVEEVLKHKAQNVLFAHNHPSGSVFPSEGDMEATKQLMKAFEAIDVNILDHIIVSGNQYYSMAEKGVL
ncbi:MAG: DNA repair protein RadC [Clostridia bacterium]|nr:DNA repair protein RadC [Clostridia bacterium]